MSNVRSRLAVLGRQAGNSAGAARETDRQARISDLRRELARVGKTRGARAAPTTTLPDEALGGALDAVAEAEGLLVRRTQIPLGTVHGRFPISGRETLVESIRFLSRTRPRADESCVFMDTETTGLSGGTGTLVFLLGMARFTRSSLEMCQLFLTGFHGELAMLEKARRWLADTDTLITYNGRSFDQPLLAARYRLAGLEDPFARLAHVDLLHATRRTFGRRWPDCRLQTVEKRLLGLERVDDLPGHEAPRAWFDWLRYGRSGLLPGVCRHNHLDVLSLAVLPRALAYSHEEPLAAGADVLACARQVGGVQGEEAAFSFLNRRRHGLDEAAKLELARLARRRRRWSLALEIWQELAGEGHMTALEHLAKYYEHREGDLEKALVLAGQLVDGAPSNPRHLHRRARLRTRLEARRRH